MSTKPIVPQRKQWIDTVSWYIFWAKEIKESQLNIDQCNVCRSNACAVRCAHIRERERAREHNYSLPLCNILCNKQHIIIMMWNASFRFVYSTNNKKLLNFVENKITKLLIKSKLERKKQFHTHMERRKYVCIRSYDGAIVWSMLQPCSMPDSHHPSPRPIRIDDGGWWCTAVHGIRGLPNKIFLRFFSQTKLGIECAMCNK